MASARQISDHPVPHIWLCLHLIEPPTSVSLEITAAMVGKRSSFEFEEDDSHEALQRAGKALLSPPKGKDQLLRLLKVRRACRGALAA